mgnify:CR=1 FL=1
MAKYAYDYGIVNKTNISVVTKSGIKYLDLTLGDDGKVALVKVNMGAPILTSRQIPVVSTKEQVIDEPLNVDWDGNELLLSDILGTDADAIYRGIEDEVDKELLSLAMKKLTPREKKIMELQLPLDVLLHSLIFILNEILKME